MGRQVGGRGPLWCGAWFAGPKCPSLAATVGLACNDARPAGLLCWCLGTGVACLGAGWVSVVGGSAQSGPPQAWAAAEGTTVTAVILAALTRHTRASGRARAGRATRAVRVAALPRGGAGQPWRTVGPGPRLVRFSAVEPSRRLLEIGCYSSSLARSSRSCSAWPSSCGSCRVSSVESVERRGGNVTF